ncbi:aminotransferase class I/II-fold pyridoxal phosphate-dependent enzyme [Paenibacillus psychroresistens]|uniref:Aminotransferase class I/II-fold pyridoxal phosphate-dependent enzyme n=1 Tax=Paenibacillus psychroresistens TaxID=1778678 RepID=A0A6B8RAR8_9BACL|nr:aminotransferase class I/II-fold pyridoxal phosphate-dependent enzyme [Paenibacillus psychroresistens]QGQ93659.1 aminotransferase class I/II-fold pyridoxal phosphate-dependent enzyme [Paenibacillus psychroresistens]
MLRGKLNQNKAPLYEKMHAHRFQRRASFHVPGHKNGNGLDPEGIDSFSAIMSIDYTELPSLDDLHHPTGVILEAEQLAADCFGAEKSFFLVNGSTVGNLAMILAACARDEILIVQRNVHKSIIHGLMLAGAKAVFLPPRWDTASQLATGVNLEDILTAMNQYPNAKGVLLSNPNYYGMGIHLSEIADTVHSRGIPLLVDEAHGAHFGFHPLLPQSALASGADIVVQSTHKMLTAMTMGAMLHIQGNRVDSELIQQRLGMLQSSSPSYPIMASLDLCRRWIYQQGEHKLAQSLQIVKHLREQIQSKLPAIAILERAANNLAYETLDPFKLTISDRTGTWSGYQLRDKLEQEGCDAEMADARHVLLHFSLASDERDAERLFKALSDIFSVLNIKKQDFSLEIANNNNVQLFTQISAPIPMNLQQQKNSLKVKAVPLEMAIGSISAEMVIPYPPGIPLLYVGEEVTENAVSQIKWIAKQGAAFQGSKEPQLDHITVFIE